MEETVKKTKTPAKPRAAAAKPATESGVKSPARKKKTAPVESIQKARPAGPSHDQIAALARRYWAERGYADGKHEEDWFRAEQELSAKAS